EVDGARCASYGIGFQAESGVVFRRTVYGVQEVRVSVWADEASQNEMVYRYVGPERDKDIRAILDDKMHLTWQYQPLLGGDVSLTLTGIAGLPSHRLTLTFHPKATSTAGPEPVQFAWDQREWKKDEVRPLYFPTRLKFEPETMDVAISFAGVGYEWKRTV